MNARNVVLSATQKRNQSRSYSSQSGSPLRYCSIVELNTTGDQDDLLHRLWNTGT